MIYNCLKQKDQRSSAKHYTVKLLQGRFVLPTTRWQVIHDVMDYTCCIHIYSPLVLLCYMYLFTYIDQRSSAKHYTVKLLIEQNESHKISECYERVSSSSSTSGTRRITVKITRASCGSLICIIYISFYIRGVTAGVVVTIVVLIITVIAIIVVKRRYVLSMMACITKDGLYYRNIRVLRKG
jgi:hypothetical protein